MATVIEALTLAIQHHQTGQLQAAEEIYRHVLQVEPNQADALHFLGVIASGVGKLDTAIAYMTRALEIKSDNADAHYNLGNAYRKQGNLYEAAACYQRALALKPGLAEANINLGVTLSDLADAQCNEGAALSAQGQLDEAVACYRRALALRPDYAEAHNDLGVALCGQQKLEEGSACYRRALALKPDYAEAHCNLGAVLGGQGQLDEAVACYQRALALKPDYAEAHYNVGNALKEQGKLEDAVACYHRALALRPEYPEAHNNLGNALKDQGKLGEARTCYERALAVKPDYVDVRWNQSLLKLLTGDFEHGWAEYEWRWHVQPQVLQRRHFAQPLWDGQPLAGRIILIHAEQGLGDTIQFVRYVQVVKERGGRVVLECQCSLLPLLAGCSGIDRLVAQGEPLPAFEVQAPLLSLPRILGTTLDDIPGRVPYLQADPELTECWREKLAGMDGLKVGIVWQGNPQIKGDRQRSIPLHHFEPLARVEGVQLLSLQKGIGADQVRTASFPILDFGAQLETFGDAAAVLRNLDLLISSCTSVPHLAGALGVPVWLALAHVPDWRWLLERDDSPWYPYHRLFRQTRPGEWREVFERMAAALSALKKGVRRQES